MRKSNFTNLQKSCSPEPKGTFPKVAPNLAITPSQMMELASHGVPVSLQNAANFNDGQVNPPWDVPAERVRGVDMADLWQLQMSSRSKLKDAKAQAAAQAAAQASKSE